MTPKRAHELNGFIEDAINQAEDYATGDDMNVVIGHLLDAQAALNAAVAAQEKTS